MSKYIIILILIPYVSIGQINDLKLKILEGEEKVDSLNSVIKLEEKKLEEYKLNLLRKELKELGLPSGVEGEIVWHSAMVINYNEKHEQANWVYHQIHPDVVKGNFTRTNDFRIDSSISTISSEELDYFTKEVDPGGKVIYDGFGYDRGHIAPSADFRWSQKALSESYFYSNMSPQVPELNRERWAELEGVLRGYVARTHHPLYVVAGPILHDSLSKIPRSVNKVSVPESFFKIAYDPMTNNGIGFIMPNDFCKEYVEQYAVSIDSVEKLVGFKFFLSQNDVNKIDLDIITWLPKSNQNDTKPFSINQLPKKAINTLAAKNHIGSGKKVIVCGTVVSAKKSRKGNVFLNLDRSFPNHVFSVTIWKADAINFSYQPNVYLDRRKICVSGKIGDHQGVPSVNIKKEESIEVLD